MKVLKGNKKNVVGILLVAFLGAYCRTDNSTSNGTPNPSQWYVDPSAPDGGDGLSPQTAFNSITMAILPHNQAWEPGDDIILLPGNYMKQETLDFSQLSIPSGYIHDYLTIIAKPGVILTQPLIIKGAQYLALDSLYFEDVYGEALVIENSSGIIIQNSSFTRIHNLSQSPDPGENIPGNAIHIKGVSGATVRDCYVVYPEGTGIFLESSTSVYIYGISLSDAGETGILIDSSQNVEIYNAGIFTAWIGLLVRGYSDGVYVHYSAMANSAFAGFATSFPSNFSPQKGLKIERLLLARNNVGMYLSGDKYTKVTNITAAHNQDAGVVLSRTAGVEIVNSISAFNGAGFADYARTSIDTYINYVDVWANTNGNFINIFVDPNLFYIFEHDPQFVDPSAFDYSLMATSPCIDAGDPNIVPPQGGEPFVDLGALEYIKTDNSGPIM